MTRAECRRRHGTGHLSRDRGKIWKLSDMDIKSYPRWYEYSRTCDEMFLASDTSWAPRYVVHSDNKRRARLNALSHILCKIPTRSCHVRKSNCRSGSIAETTRIPVIPLGSSPRCCEQPPHDATSPLETALSVSRRGEQCQDHDFPCCPLSPSASSR